MSENATKLWLEYLRRSGGRDAMFDLLMRVGGLDLSREASDAVRELARSAYDIEREACAAALDAYIEATR
jgi:hypothetical protein